MANALDSPTILPLLSEPRLSTFVSACNGDHCKALRLYSWNIEVSAAMWGGFAVLEVCLRNAIGNRLEALTGQPDWWEAPNITLHTEQQDAIRNAARGPRQTHHSHNGIVSNLTLGFWTSLLANRYHQHLWVPAIRDAFPNHTGRRSELQQRLEALRRLRNRRAHHEPVFNRALEDDYNSVLTVLEAIDISARDWVMQASRVPAVIAARADTVAGRRHSQF